MPEQKHRRLADLPVSARLVYKVLEYEGSLTQKEIKEEAAISQRTAYNALDDLEDIGAIETSLADDLRQTVYSIK